MRNVLRSKIHNAYVTEANLAYIGSITIDEALMEAVGLWEGRARAGGFQYLGRQA
ncbi:MAG: aspartate 1-decarboxylase [Asticcacaulis sp.]